VVTFKAKKFCELLPPPTNVKMIKLYVLLLEINIITSMQLLKELEECMSYLMKMKIEGTLCNGFVATFREWFLYPLVSIFTPYCSSFGHPYTMFYY
jgi:hypothetical protein